MLITNKIDRGQNLPIRFTLSRVKNILEY